MGGEAHEHLAAVGIGAVLVAHREADAVFAGFFIQVGGAGIRGSGRAVAEIPKPGGRLVVRQIVEVARLDRKSVV